eukprot:PhM_4_TR5257/c0_g1_i1/m.41769
MIPRTSFKTFMPMPELGRRRALIVGVDYTASNRSVRVEHASLDALRLAAFFKLNNFATVRFLTNRQATLRNINDELSRLSSECIDGDVVIVFFAGIGLKDDAGHMCWAVADTLLGKTATYLRQRDVSAALAKLQCAQVLLCVAALPVQLDMLSVDSGDCVGGEEPQQQAAGDTNSSSDLRYRHASGCVRVEVLRPTRFVLSLEVSEFSALTLLQGLLGHADIVPSGEITVSGLLAYLADTHVLDEPDVNVPGECNLLYKYDVRRGEGLGSPVRVRVSFWLAPIGDSGTSVSGDESNSAVLNSLASGASALMRSMSKPQLVSGRRRRERFLLILRVRDETLTTPMTNQSFLTATVRSMAPLDTTPTTTMNTTTPENNVELNDADGPDENDSHASSPLFPTLQFSDLRMIRELISATEKFTNACEFERFHCEARYGTLSLQFSCVAGGMPHMAIEELERLVPTYCLSMRVCVDVEGDTTPKYFHSLDEALRRQWVSVSATALSSTAGHRAPEALPTCVPVSVVLTGASHPTERVNANKGRTQAEVKAMEENDSPVAAFHNVASLLRPVKEQHLRHNDLLLLCTSRNTTCMQLAFHGDRVCPIVEELSDSVAPNYERCVFRFVKAAEDDQWSMASDGRDKIHFGQQIRILNVFTGSYLALVEDPGLFSYDLGSAAPKFAFLSPPASMLELEKHQPAQHQQSKCSQHHHQATSGLASFEQSTTFVVQPRYKMREDGDVVRLGDHISLVHVGTSKIVAPANTHLRYLEPTRKYPIALHGDTSVAPAWIALNYMRHSERSGTQVEPIFSGSVITILHKEMGGLLTATSSDETGDNVSFDCSKRAQTMDDDSTFAKYSSNALWVIESDKPYAGGVVEWAAQSKLYRLRHMATGLYLSCEVRVNEDNEREVELSLTRDFLQDSTLIALHCMLQGADSEGGLTEVKMVRIEFVRVRHWLSCASSSPVSDGGTVFFKAVLAPAPVYEGVFLLSAASDVQKSRLFTVHRLLSIFPRFANYDFISEAKKADVHPHGLRSEPLFLCC